MEIVTAEKEDLKKIFVLYEGGEPVGTVTIKDNNSRTGDKERCF